MRVKLPSGEVIWTRVAEREDVPVDVGFDDVIHHLDDLGETIRGVSRSVRASLAKVRPDNTTIEFGVELSFKSGKLISVLAEAGGRATLSVTLSWGQGDEVESEPDVSVTTTEAAGEDES